MGSEQIFMDVDTDRDDLHPDSITSIEAVDEIIDDLNNNISTLRKSWQWHEEQILKEIGQKFLLYIVRREGSRELLAGSIQELEDCHGAGAVKSLIPPKLRKFAAAEDVPGLLCIGPGYDAGEHDER